MLGGIGSFGFVGQGNDFHFYALHFILYTVFGVFMSEIDGRIARLEQRADTMQCSIIQINEEHRRKSDKVQETLEEIQEQLTRYKGFYAGVAFAFTIIASFIVYAVSGGWIHK